MVFPVRYREKYKDIYDLNWCRYGHGHNFPFYATHKEISDIFLEAMKPTVDEAYICGVDLLKKEGEKFYKEYAFLYPLEELTRCLKEHPEALNYGIGLEHLTSSKQLYKLSNSGIISLNGLINLQIFNGPMRMTNCIPPSRLGIVGRILSLSDNETLVEHTEYLKLYNKLKRVMKKLSYRTFFHGSPHEDRSCRMSEGICQEWKKGVVLRSAAFCRGKVHRSGPRR